MRNIINNTYLSKPLYIHFLNREMARSVNFQFKDIEIDRILKVILLSTSDPLYSSFAFIWEHSHILPRTTKTLSLLSKQKQLELVSNFATINEFISSCQSLYKYDADRYPMYFKSLPIDLLNIIPSILKEKSTTNFIASELLQFSENYKNDISDLLSESDWRNLEITQRAIYPLVYYRNESAITLSLFEKGLPESQIRINKYSIARLLSLIHLKHYMNFLGVEVPTGIKGLTYFDRVTNSFPIHDIDFLLLVFEYVGLTNEELDKPELLNKILQFRNTKIHLQFIQSIRYILNAAVFISSLRYSQYLITPRPLIRLILKNILANKHLYINKKQKRQNPLLDAYDEINKILLIAGGDPLFLQFNKYYNMNRVKVLLISATNLETKVIIDITENIYGLTMTRLHIKDHTIYALGTLEEIEIFLVQSEMGSETPGSVTLTANDVIEYLNPNCIISIGIAFGLKEKEQKLGDIIVSKQIRQYDSKKLIGKDRILARGDKVHASTRMLDRFRSGKIDWNNCNVHFGLILSGNTLVNSSKFRKFLLQLEPEAIGGEMEAGGIYTVCTKRKVEWIVVKGISDWGMDKNDKDQEIAITNSIKYVFHVLSNGGFAI